MRKFLLAGIALIGLSGGWAVGDYAATQGSGTTFGSLVSGGIHYTKNLLCDATAAASCATVTAGSVSVSVTNANANGSAISANSSPVVIAPDQVAVAVKAASGTIASGAVASGAIASGAISSGAYASGSIGSGAIASGALASGAYTSGSVASGAYASGSLASGAVVDITNVSTPIAPASATATKGLLLGGQYNSTIPAFTNGQQGSLQVASNGALRQIPTNPYPDTAVPYTATATGTTGATTATLAGAASVTTYLCGFSIRANATAAVTGNATVTGVITATMNFTQWTAPLASGLGITEMIFSPCIPASGTNQSVAVVSAAPGTGGVVSVTAWGYKL